MQLIHILDDLRKLNFLTGSAVIAIPFRIRRKAVYTANKAEKVAVAPANRHIARILIVVILFRFILMRCRKLLERGKLTLFVSLHGLMKSLGGRNGKCWDLGPIRKAVMLLFKSHTVRLKIHKFPSGVPDHQRDRELFRRLKLCLRCLFGLFRLLRFPIRNGLRCLNRFRFLLAARSRAERQQSTGQNQCRTRFFHVSALPKSAIVSS